MMAAPRPISISVGGEAAVVLRRGILFTRCGARGLPGRVREHPRNRYGRAQDPDGVPVVTNTRNADRSAGLHIDFPRARAAGDRGTVELPRREARAAEGAGVVDGMHAVG